MKDLVCTNCGKTLMSGASDEMTKMMQAGYCNNQSCQGKLIWKESVKK